MRSDWRDGGAVVGHGGAGDSAGAGLGHGGTGRGGMDGAGCGAVARGRLWRRKAARGCAARALELAAARARMRAMASSRKGGDIGTIADWMRP